MTTTIPRPLMALSLLVAGSLVGCDAEAPAARSVDYRAVGHVQLSAVTRAPWIASAKKDDMLQLDAALGPCADLVRTADALTFGAKEDAFEVYVEGSFDSAAANACADHIDAEVAAGRVPRRDGRPKPEATLLADGLFVVFGGDLTPSRDRLDALSAASPSPGQPMWVTVDMRDKGHPVEHVEAWADPSKGLSAHAQVTFADEQKAAEIYGKATLGLTALTLSDEVGDLASAVDLSSSGKSMTAKVQLSAAQMKTLVAKGKARHEAHAKFGHHPHGPGHGDHEPGIRIEFKTAD